MIESLFNQEQIQELRDSRVEFEKTKAEIASGVDLSYRNTDMYHLHKRMWPEHVEILEDAFEGKVVQMDYLVYTEGMFFKPHVDRDHKSTDRDYTTSTLLYKSDDLIGGELCVEPHGMVDMQVGQTVAFDAGLVHEVKKVEAGVREVLIAWIKSYK